MLDLKLTGGLVVDGSGAPGVRSDVGVRHGRVVAVGDLDEPATDTIDCTDLVVAPGFVDIHTHYDAQVFWDTTLSPSPLHGVTTVFAGNCGFTLAPITTDPRDGDYLMRMLSRVEGMPLESLLAGVPLDWTSTAEYLDRIDGTLMPNAGFLVGHSALRRAVLHDDAATREATPAEVEQMAALLHSGLAAGGMGFSSTWSTTHNDHEGNPVPSRWASRQELLALCAVVRVHPGTTLEFIPQVGRLTEESMRLMGAMSAAADRPINWNFIQVYAVNREVVDHQLTGADIGAEEGGRVVALTLPDSFRMRLNFASGFVLDILPGWDKLMALPHADKKAMLADPVGRARMDALAQSDRELRRLANWGSYLLVETHTESHKRFLGRPFAEIATELGCSPWDALADLVVADDLRTVIMNRDAGQDNASWARRVEVWRDGRALPGASDAGAHLDMIDSFAASTQMLAEAVRKRGLLPIEEAIHYLTGAPAALYGLHDRGRLAVGACADLVVLDPTRVGPTPFYTRFDMPAGAGRIYGEAEGIEHVFVNGTEVVRANEFTDARPGRILRSGTDTHTVTVAGL
jgi:N-acyl-D-aspartate/D-glutamate deacylase